MATLNGIVHVTDETGTAHVFGPDDEVPEWAQTLITNPKAWAEAPPSTAKRLTEPAAKPPTKRAAQRRKADGDAVRTE